jgi:hypothetical protein
LIAVHKDVVCKRDFLYVLLALRPIFHRLCHQSSVN